MTDTFKPFKFFRDTFGLKLNEYLDTQLSLLCKTPQLDLNKFESWLHSKHGIKDNESIESVLLKYYGQDAVDQVKALI
jgi:hypothetical protein